MIPRRAHLFLIGLALVLAGSVLAQIVQGTGDIALRDVQFRSAGGHQLAATLYIPPGATDAHPAPAVLTVHTTLASRASQSGLAIELARRGYVVLALDQPGHGQSDPRAFADGLGGADGLRYLRALDIVDPARIGLEGHGTGGAAVLMAAETTPDQYQAMVLDGAAPGGAGLRDGTPDFPRNLAVIYGRYDGFSRMLWGTERATDIGRSEKLTKLFGVHQEVVAGRIYGDRLAGTARVLFSPPIANPMAPISREAIGDAVSWFDRSLRPGEAIKGTDQVWMWQAVGRVAALVGLLMVLLGTFHLLLGLPPFHALIDQPDSAVAARDGHWWCDAFLTAWVPVMTFFAFLRLGAIWLPPGAIFRQAIPNQLLVWMLLNAIITLGVGRLLGISPATATVRLAPAIGIAMASFALCLLMATVAAQWFAIDFGFWIFALRPMNAGQFLRFLIYLPGFTLALGIGLHRLNTGLSVYNDSALVQYFSNIATLAGGIFIFLAVQYGTLLTRGQLLSWSQPTNIVLALQLLPIVVAVAVVATFTWRRTGNALVGGLMSGMLVTWYFVVGQATNISW